MQLTHTSRQPRSLSRPRQFITWLLHMPTTIEPAKPGTPTRLSALPAWTVRQPIAASLSSMAWSRPQVGMKVTSMPALPPDLGRVPAFGVRAAHGAGIAEKEDLHCNLPIGQSPV